MAFRQRGIPTILPPGGGTKFFFQFFLMFPDSSHYKKYNGSCFMYLSEILSKLQMLDNEAAVQTLPIN